MKVSAQHPTFLEAFGFKQVLVEGETTAVARWAISLTRDEFFEHYLYPHFKVSGNDKLVTAENFLSAEIQVNAYDTPQYNRDVYRYDYAVTINVCMDEPCYKQTSKGYTGFIDTISKNVFTKLIRQSGLVTLHQCI